MTKPFTKICPVSPAAQPSIVAINGIDVIVDQSGSQPRLWLNSCPHTGAPLAMQADELICDTGEFECCLHGAKFERSTGLCVSGPCKSEYLETVPSKIESGYILGQLP